MGKRFTVKQQNELYIVVDSFVNEPVNHYNDYDDALNDADCRNKDEEQYGNE